MHEKEVLSTSLFSLNVFFFQAYNFFLSVFTINSRGNSIFLGLRVSLRKGNSDLFERYFHQLFSKKIRKEKTKEMKLKKISISRQGYSLPMSSQNFFFFFFGTTYITECILPCTTASTCVDFLFLFYLMVGSLRTRSMTYLFDISLVLRTLLEGPLSKNFLKDK